MLKKGDKLGRWTVLSDQEYILGETLGLGLSRGLRDKPTVRVRCVCGLSKYMHPAQLKANLARNPDTGCNSKKCLNEYRASKEE